MAEISMNLGGVKEEVGFELLPPGWYGATVTDSEIKEGGKGPYINWTFSIENKPNKVWEIMSLGAESHMKKLKTLAICSGHPDPNYIADTDELHGRSCQVRLKVEKDETGTYEPKNKISAFKPHKKNGAATPQPVPTAMPTTAAAEPAETTAAATPPATETTTRRPWE